MKSLKNKNVAELDDTLPEVWKTTKYDEILLRLCNVECNRSWIEKWTKGDTLPFPKKDDLKINNNYKDITHTANS